MKALPPEILLQIFEEATPRQLYKYTFVCKAWEIPARLALYSHIKIDTESRLEKFCNTISHSPHLGYNVKTLVVELEKEWFCANRENLGTKVTNVLNKLLPLLHNLEEFPDSDPYNYTPTLNALSSSHLKHLKILGAPVRRERIDDERKYSDYLSCALLMKDRLEYISLTDEIFINTPLGQELDQFKNLLEIEIMLQTNNEIGVLERCGTAKKISFNFNPFTRMMNGSSLRPPAFMQQHISMQQPTYVDQPTFIPQPLTFIHQSNNHSTASVSNYIPNVAVKSLSGILTDDNSFDFIMYIMRKFPQLNELDLQFALLNPVHFDLSVIADLFVYLSRIDKVSIGHFLLNQTNILQKVGAVWDMTSLKPVCLDICYDTSRNTSTILNIFRDETTNRTSLRYGGPDFEWLALYELVLKSGGFFSDLQFSCISFHLSSLLYLPDNFISHTLVNCPNLQNLHIEGCLLKRLDFDVNTSYSLHRLRFRDCAVYDGVLEQLSQVLNDIDRLELKFVKFLGSNNEPHNSVISITMPNTSIHTLILRGFKTNDIAFVKVASIDENRCCYYRCSFARYKHTLVESNEQQYNASNDDIHIHIQCRSNTTIKM